MAKVLDLDATENKVCKQYRKDIFKKIAHLPFKDLILKIAERMNNAPKRPIFKVSFIICDLLILLAIKKTIILKSKISDKINKKNGEWTSKLVNSKLTKINTIELINTCFLNTDIIFKAK